MNTQAYLVVGMSFVFMVTNLLGAAFTISRLRSKTTHVTGIASVDREPMGAHGQGSPGQKSNATAALFVRVGAFHLAAEGVAIITGLGIAVLGLFALLKIL